MALKLYFSNSGISVGAFGFPFWHYIRNKSVFEAKPIWKLIINYTTRISYWFRLISAITCTVLFIFIYTLFFSVIFQFFVRIIFNLNRNQFCIFDSRVCVSTKSLISWRRLYRIVVPKIVVASVFFWGGGIGFVFVFKVIEFWPLTRRRGRSNLFSILAMAVTPPVRTKSKWN